MAAEGPPQQLDESIVLPSSDNDDLNEAYTRRYGRLFHRRRRGQQAGADRLGKYE